VGIRVVRTRRGFRVVLHCKERKFAMANAFDGAIVEVEVGDLECRRSRHATLVADDGEAMVLCGDQDASRSGVAHRMIAPAMAIRQLDRKSVV